ncbi:hypothetical protein [Taibaiella chishuiensis]|uniref:Secreted protein with PEP-CTERM sorting signal n=1 Tax=Taibaiella chishuiensis TaxID=1434707 RepID=A0A2P8DBR0_9BACT|nr:hypothetical protein [Taibaiella chishuiensis]PSK94617.1 hypothetical protein B0I18_101776 [Taibaiella chishuiensis]
MKKILFLLTAAACCATDTWAQGCAVCTKTAAGLGQSSASGLNNGILYLAAIPLAFMGTVGFIWWKRNRA